MVATRALRVALVLALLVLPTIEPVAAQEPPKCGNSTATIYGQSGTIEGTSGNDVIVGSEGKDVIKGLDGLDVICGMGGNDKLRGGNDSDILDGGAGDDTLSGGPEGPEGDDVRYLSAPNEVKVDLEGLGAANAEGDGDDRIVNVENIVGSQFDDTLRGNSKDNIIDGGDGDDVVFGRDGADELAGDAGSDVVSPGGGNDPDVDGGNGDDTISYRGAEGGVQINFLNAEVTGGWGKDTFTTFENAAGSNYSDEFTGNSDPNQFFGYKGTDALQGNGGSDLLDGGSNDDLFRGGEGQDTLIGGPGQHDTASYEDATGDVVADLGPVGGQGSANPDGFGTSDSLTEIEDLVASYGTVNFTGNDLDNILIGCDKADTINGGGGNDTIHGQLLGDTINGGPGNDTIYGEDGDDTLHGGADNDELYGGTGTEDKLYGDEGNLDFADGGTGGDPTLLEHDFCDAETEEKCETDQPPQRAPAQEARRLF